MTADFKNEVTVDTAVTLLTDMATWPTLPWARWLMSPARPTPPWWRKSKGESSARPSGTRGCGQVSRRRITLRRPGALIIYR